MPTGRIRPVEPVRLYKQVVEQVMALIASGELAPGDRLPAERALADQLEVSRASVRQALTVLEISGAVQVKAGSGVYVCQPTQDVSDTAATLTELAAPLEILETRLLFEPGVARLAAGRRSDDDITAMQQLITTMGEELAEGKDSWEADWGFHEALGRATQNPSIEHFTVVLRGQMGERVWALMRHRNLGHAERSTRYLNDHAAILRAIRRGDAVRSESLMTRHINHVISDLNKAQATL